MSKEGLEKEVSLKEGPLRVDEVYELLGSRGRYSFKHHQSFSWCLGSALEQICWLFWPQWGVVLVVGAGRVGLVVGWGGIRMKDYQF